ncbi:MAG: cupin domain-containing protein [Gammaproteobacteria bacterium]
MMKYYLLSLCFFALALLSPGVIADGHAKAELPNSTFKFTRIAIDEQDRSHFAEGELPFTLKEFAPPSGPIGVSPVSDAKTILFTTADKTWITDWHPTPRRQFVIMLAGAITVEVESGEKRTFEKGDIFLLEDIRGRGHDSRVVSDEPAMFTMVALPD